MPVPGGETAQRWTNAVSRSCAVHFDDGIQIYSFFMPRPPTTAELAQATDRVTTDRRAALRPVLVPSWRRVARRVPSQGTPGSARMPEAAGQAPGPPNCYVPGLLPLDLDPPDCHYDAVKETKRVAKRVQKSKAVRGLDKRAVKAGADVLRGAATAATDGLVDSALTSLGAPELALCDTLAPRWACL